MSRPRHGVPDLERVEAIIYNEAIYALAELIPDADSTHGGRRRQYPTCVWIIYEALISVYGSARKVDAELSHPIVWGFLRDAMRARFPHRPDRWLPAAPMRRHHYLYARNRYLTHPAIFELLTETHRQIAADEARYVGLMDPAGPGSWTHPDLSRMLHADGKVITSLFRAKPGDTHIDPATGEIRSLRHDPDGQLHIEGDGEAAWGTKFVLVAARTTDPHGRIILDIEWAPKAGSEAATAMDCFTRLAPLLPGAHGVIYDTALRGVHHQTLLRDLGLLPVNRVTAAHAGAKQPRRADRRVEKSAHIEDKTVIVDGRPRTVSLYARGGALGIGELTDTGDLTFTQLSRFRTHRNQDKTGRYRWYNDYRLPDRYGSGTVTVRLHASPADAARHLNRTENLRPIPPTDPDFARLYPRRNDSESINRNLEDTLWLGRAHSVGHTRQHLNLLGYALMVNGLALHRHRRHRQPLAA
jgi:hypothetical protein